MTRAVQCILLVGGVDWAESSKDDLSLEQNFCYYIYCLTLTLQIPRGQVRPSIADMTICVRPPVAPPQIIKFFPIYHFETDLYPVQCIKQVLSHTEKLCHNHFPRI